VFVSSTVAADPAVKLPPGTRLVEGRHVVAGGMVAAVRFIDRQLTRAGISFERIGPYSVRGVEVTRFISQQASTPWLAVHLVRKEGRTFLDIVERTNPLTNPSQTR
jgi:hypothetical protein